MTKRLFTFGCSYTQYKFPTWADFLGLEFDHYENWALAGIGCRAIAERLTECHARNNITKDDVVIVQWTTHLRNDFYTPLSLRDREGMNWKTWGSVFSEKNQRLYDRKWLETFFFEPAYVMHCLNHMLMAQLMLDQIGCTWYMTSIGDWTKLSSDLDDITGSGEKKITAISIEKDFPELSIYVDPIWNNRKEKWIHPIALTANELPNDWWWFQEPHDKEPWREQHPSPKQQVHWLNTYLRPKLGLGNPPSFQEQWIEQLEQIKIDCKDNRQRIEDSFYNKQHLHKYWPSNYWPRSFEGYF
jgi:hypothetical protein